MTAESIFFPTQKKLNELCSNSESPLPSQIPNEGSDVHDFTSNSSIPDLSKFEGARSHIGNIGRGNTPDFHMDDSSDGEAQSGLRGRRSRTFDALKNQANSLTEIKDYKGKFLEPALSDITTVNEPTGAQNKKVVELEVKVKNYLRENKELYDKIRENEEEYLSVNFGRILTFNFTLVKRRIRRC